jgi:hypothetical protein
MFGGKVTLVTFSTVWAGADTAPVFSVFTGIFAI